MRVACYARFSSELQDRRSISDQLAALKDYVARQAGWQIVEEFTDAAISGASIHNRPGVQQLLASAKARAFDVVLTESMDRLSRDLADSAAIHKQLAFIGVPIVTLADGEMDKTRVAIKGLVASIFLDDLAQKTRRGQAGRVKAGRIPGGRCYGYDVLRDGDDRGRRAINPAEASIVRRIYAEYVAGKWPLKIVAELNAEGVPGPRGGPWNVSTIIGSAKRKNGLLNNALYRGRIVYNRQRFIKNPATGKRTARANPEREWLTHEAPELAIVDAVTWDAAQVLRAGRSPQQRAEQHRRPKHLLSGLLVCTVCGGPMVIRTWTRGVAYFGCSARMNRAGCSNDRVVPATEVQERVMVALHKYLAAPDVIEAAVETYRQERALLSRQARKARASIERDLAAVKRQYDRAWKLALAAEDDVNNHTSELKALRAKQRELEERLSLADKPDQVELHPEAAQRYAAKVKAVRQALSAGERAGFEAVALVRELVLAIRVTPTPKGEPVGLEVAGHLAALLKVNKGGTSVVKGLVAGACYSHYRACVPWLFLKKRRDVPDQFQLHGLAVVGRRDDDAVDELAHQLDGLPRRLVALRKRGVDVGHPLLVALRGLRMQGEHLVRIA
jgi:DNA invertase Pin-like site-specific DNA recombinase